ncbi:DUF1206 domain-containing protein [Kineococcus esterisolvens]|uniref:DUF1206 domain-containing protein n=1 Tax=unclassified Kineococcus TaxID=2621656 RepID=UPI003D7E9D67
MSGNDVKGTARQGERFAERHESTVKRVGRAGVVAEGVVYLLVAWLALQIAFGTAPASADTSGALSRVAAQPFGKVLLTLLTLGFAAMVAWQVLAAVAADKASRRVSAVAKALVAGVLGLSSARFVLGGGSSSGQSQQTLTQRVLEAPGGPVIVVVVGLAIVAVGIGLAVRGVVKKFEDKVEGSLSPALTALGVTGWVARGVAFGVLGVLVVLSAGGDTAKSRGLDAAFHEIAQQPYGRVLLTVVALGVAAYAVFELLTARRRRRA